MTATFGLAIENFTSAEKTPKIEELAATAKRAEELGQQRHLADRGDGQGAGSGPIGPIAHCRHAVQSPTADPRRAFARTVLGRPVWACCEADVTGS